MMRKIILFYHQLPVTAFIGILLVLTNLEENRKLNLQQAFLLTTLSWLSIAIFGCIPFFLSNLNLSFVDAFFESMSGITTTGSTIITDLDNAPKSILIWRAILQWLRWYWYNCNGNNYTSIIKYWWYAII